jgi:hypothetical protein
MGRYGTMLQFRAVNGTGESTASIVDEKQVVHVEVIRKQILQIVPVRGGAGT